MEIVQIALQVLLGLVFLAAGLTKVVARKDALRDRMAWVDSFPNVGVKAVGLAEVLGALGLLLPLLPLLPLNLRPTLALVAAICLAVTMVLAILLHIRRHEMAQTPPALILLLLLIGLIWLIAS